MAGIVAQNRAVELWTDPAPPTIGNAVTAVTNGGRNWRVEQRVARTADDSLLRIDLTVRPESGRGQAVLTITRPSRCSALRRQGSKISGKGASTSTTQPS